MKEKLTIGNVKSSRLFLIFLCCRFQVEGQGKKKTFEYQFILDRCDLDNHRIENWSVTEHHLYSGSWN
jgi:hypothetical protein